MELANVTGPTRNTQNVGGLTKRFRYSELETMATIQKKNEISDIPTPTDRKTLINIQGDHTWNLDEGAYEGYATRDTGKVDVKISEARDTTGCKTTAEVFIPGAEDEDDATLSLVAGRKTLFWFELSDGKWIQIGSEKWPAEAKYTWSSGKNEGEPRGWKLTVEGFETTKQYYPGAFTMHPAS